MWLQKSRVGQAPHTSSHYGIESFFFFFNSTRPRQISYAHKYCIIRHAVTSRPAVKNCNSSGLELQLTSQGAAGGEGSMTRRRSHIVVRQYLRIESLIEAIKRWLRTTKAKAGEQASHFPVLLPSTAHPPCISSPCLHSQLVLGRARQIRKLKNYDCRSTRLCRAV